MPVVRLRECGHMFHGACAKSPRRNGPMVLENNTGMVAMYVATKITKVQDLADRRKTCPFCRAQVGAVIGHPVSEFGYLGLERLESTFCVETEDTDSDLTQTFDVFLLLSASEQ